MKWQENFSLKQYNTFGIDIYAKYFAGFSTVPALEELISNQKEKLLILGGGSNILFTKNFDGLVLKNEISGIELINEDEHYAYVKAGAGVNWHSFVLHCIAHDFAGVENLSFIPGNVGASPMQNIGAYGVEIKDVFERLEAFDLTEKKLVQFSLNDCLFGYRESVFKRKYKDRFVIVSVTFRLKRNPEFNISYGMIAQELERMNIEELSIKAVSQAVINIRRSKLPDPAETGNAGSFFKNPTISNEQYKALKEKHSDMVGYPVADNKIKLAAGWLIEQCGWKGYRDGDAGCHAKQALVLVNYGIATGNDIYTLSEKILESVKSNFGIELEREVNIV